MPKPKGYRSRMRRIFRKKVREKGLQPLGRLLISYRPGDKVKISISSSFPKGMPHRRYHGKIGEVKERKGRSYVVEMRVGEKKKLIIVRPEHLLPVL